MINRQSARDFFAIEAQRTRKRLCALCVSVMILLFAQGIFADTSTTLLISTFGKQPRVALGRGSEIYVVFGRGNSIFLQLSEDHGKTFSEPAKVADVDQLMLGSRRGPQLAVTEKYVTVIATGKAGNLQAWRSVDRGLSWTGPVNVNDEQKTAGEGLHALSALKGDEIFATWLDLRLGKNDLFGARSSDGGKTWSKNILIYHSPDGHICECCNPSVASDGKRRVYVMWRNWLSGARDIYAASSKDGGQTFGPATRLGSGTWVLKACPMDGGSLALTAKGEVRTVWRREDKIFGSGISGTEILLGQGTQPVIAESRNGSYILWQSNGSILMVGPKKKETVVLGKGLFPSVAPNSSSRHSPVAVWEDDQGIRFLSM